VQFAGAHQVAVAPGRAPHLVRQRLEGPRQQLPGLGVVRIGEHRVLLAVVGWGVLRGAE
jgi:hypothetical protein